MNRSRIGHRFGRWLVVLLGVSTASISQAINFDLIYLDQASDSRAKPPLEDPNGARLRAIVEHAAAEWTDIVEDNHTIELRYFYGDEMAVPSQTAVAQTLSATSDGRRTLVGELIFYNERDWYWDLTPSTDSEFAMAATLLGDLSPSEQSAGYVQTGTPIPQLEVGYRGQASDPAVLDKIDLLSTARHEIGHHMGVTGAPQLSYISTEAADGDYDFPASLLSGRRGAVKTFGASLNPPIIFEAHLEAADPLMSGQGTARGIRRDITEADVYAAASIGNWTQIDLPRKTYYGVDSTYSNPANWSGRRVPDLLDEVSIRHGGVVGLAEDHRVESLLIAEGSIVRTNAQLLHALGQATIGLGENGDTSEIDVRPGGTLRARRVVVDRGTLTLSGGQAVMPQGSMHNEEGVVQGHGQVSFDLVFENRGVLRAEGGTLALESAFNTGLLDLGGDDGSGGNLEALSGNLDINVGLAGATGGAAATFKAAMLAGPGHRIEVESSVHLLPGSIRDPAGTINLTGSGSQAALFRGTELTSQGVIGVDRLGEIDAGVRLQTGSTTVVPHSNDQLTLKRDLSLEGGSVVGEGVVVVDGPAEFSSGAIEIGELVLAGEAILGGATVEVPTIDASAAGLTQNDGRLAFSGFKGKLVQEGGTIDLTFVEEGPSSLFGTLQQGPASEVMLAIAGKNEFNQLIVSGSAAIDGALHVTLADDYDPLGGEQFPVLTAGEELAIESLTLTGPDADRFEIDIQGDTIVLEALAELAGDYNGDGLVDAADYTVWRDGGLDADGNNDGQVNAADYAIWENNYGATASSRSAAVPEPLALVLALIGLAGKIRCR